MRNKYEIKIKILRHGKTVFNEKHCYIGVTDAPLSETGIEEINRKKESGIYKKCENVFVSPMLRAKQSADIMFGNVTKIEIDDFREMDFGSFEGLCYEDLKDNLHYRRWIDKSRGMPEEELASLYSNISIDNSVTLPEDKESFNKRVIAGFDKVLSLSKDKDMIAIVAHGGTLMAIASYYGSDEYYNCMANCGEGLEVTVEYTEDENGNIEVSCFSINNRIRA